MPEQTPLLAVLIDADNTSPKWTQAIFDEIASIGEASVRRCYGDFSSQQMNGWNRVQAEFGLVPHHSPANTVGKNASDIALVIDAMDLMHTGRFDGFVLVSSDSDFTRLATRIRDHKNVSATWRSLKSSSANWKSRKKMRHSKKSIWSRERSTSFALPSPFA